MTEFRLTRQLGEQKESEVGDVLRVGESEVHQLFAILVYRIEQEATKDIVDQDPTSVPRFPASPDETESAQRSALVFQMLLDWPVVVGSREEAVGHGNPFDAHSGDAKKGFLKIVAPYRVRKRAVENTL